VSKAVCYPERRKYIVSVQHKKIFTHKNYLSKRFRIMLDKWLIALMMEAASTYETSVNFYPTTRRNIPEDTSSSYSPP
jgi:hypothetical protein